MQNAAQHYKNQEIMTASPAKLVAMLYDRAIFCLKDAIRAIDAGEIEKRNKANTKAFEIINHLDRTLDMEKGGEVAANLSRLYSYILRQLPRVDFENNTAIAEEMISLLEPLRDSWKQLADQGASGAQAAAAQTNASAYAAKGNGAYGTTAPSSSPEKPAAPAPSSLNFSA